MFAYKKFRSIRKVDREPLTENQNCLQNYLRSILESQSIKYL